MERAANFPTLWRPGMNFETGSPARVSGRSGS